MTLKAQLLLLCARIGYTPHGQLPALSLPALWAMFPLEVDEVTNEYQTAQLESWTLSTIYIPSPITVRFGLTARA